MRRSVLILSACLVAGFAFGSNWPQWRGAHGTGVADGDRVVAWFGSAGLHAYDLNGRELWHRDLGQQKHIWGNGASPIIYKDLCILNFGPGERSFLIAVDKKSGKTVWQHDEAGGDSGEKKPDQSKPLWVGSWSTPIVIPVGD